MLFRKSFRQLGVTCDRVTILTQNKNLITSLDSNTDLTQFITIIIITKPTKIIEPTFTNTIVSDRSSDKHGFTQLKECNKKLTLDCG